MALTLSLAVVAVLISPMATPTVAAGPLAFRTIDVLCPIAFEFDFEPPLNGTGTSAARTTASLTACGSPNGMHRDLGSAVLFADKADATATGCSPLPLVVQGTATILWSNDTSSTLDFKISTDLTKGLALGGHIRSGTLAGDDIVALPVLLTQRGACGRGAGVESLTINLGVDLFVH